MENQTGAGTAIVSIQLWQLQLFMFRFEQMRSSQTVVIKAWLESTTSGFWFFYLFKCLDGDYPSDNNRFWKEMIVIAVYPF